MSKQYPDGKGERMDVLCPRPPEHRLSFTRSFTRNILAITLILNLAVVGQMVLFAIQTNLLSRDSRLIIAYTAGMSCLLIAIIIQVFWLREASQTVSSENIDSKGLRQRCPISLIRAITDWLQRLGRWNFLLFGLCIGLFAFAVLNNPLVQSLPGQYTRYIDNYPLRLFLFWLLSLIGMILLKAAGVDRSWPTLLAASLVIAATGFKLASFFPDITNYPFSLGWSEASRYYYASLYRSHTLYGQAVPPTVLHPSRYLLQALPFLFSTTPIWVHRLWQDILWLSTTVLTSYLLVRRLRKPLPTSLDDHLLRWIFILWACLYLLMAPVYYHLLITIILVLWGFDRKKPWQTLLVVLLASTWAGISRINWFPVPGMLAAILFFIEEYLGNRSLFRYLQKPILWVGLGTLAAFAAQAVYVYWSGNPSEQFGSSFTSDMLWYRLMPNATYPLGILLSVILVTLPLTLILLGDVRINKRFYHWIRLLGVASILFVLFAGGIIVSVKIGGGSNLHNLDAFLVLLLVTAGYCLFGQVAREETLGSVDHTYRPSLVVLALALALPIIFTLQAPAAMRLPGKAEVNQALMIIQEAVNQAVQKDSKVLFISERQLMMFKNISGVDLVPDYEKVFLMEMAMSNNRAYLETFYDNLKNHHYALIVSEPVKISYQDRMDSFGEENNAWVDRVSKQILCYYEPVKTLKAFRTQLLAPRQQAGNCE